MSSAIFDFLAFRISRVLEWSFDEIECLLARQSVRRSEFKLTRSAKKLSVVKVS
jgi:hypothetical protein